MKTTETPGRETDRTASHGRRDASEETTRPRVDGRDLADHPLRSLHRQSGNRAVGRLLARGSSRPANGVETVGRSPDVGRETDRGEREAERVAERVVEGDGPSTLDPAPAIQERAGGSTPAIQRQRGSGGSRTQAGSQTQAQAGVANTVASAIPLLRGALGHLSGANRELLDRTIDLLGEFFPTGYGLRDAQGRDVRRSTRARYFTTVKRGRMGIGRPFIYDVYLYLSDEQTQTAAGRFRPMPGGGQIILFTPHITGQSPEAVASLLVHEVVHLMSHMRRRMAEMRGEEAAAQYPTRGTSALLDPAPVSSEREAMVGHFEALVRHINAEVSAAVSDLPVEETADQWADLLVEEVLAYLFSDEVEEAVATQQAQQRAQSGSSGVAVTPGSLVPMQFLRNYLREVWLHDPQRRAALGTPGATRIIRGMSDDLRALVAAVRGRF